MSVGATVKFDNEGPPFEVFPSLPDSVLEKMGIHKNSARGHFSEEKLEQMFTSLALAFAIDATTIEDRCERQRRYRDQTERNLSQEIDKFKEKLELLQPLCTDYEKVELLSSLFTQIDAILKATSMISWEAERYGSIQQEDRLANSVQLMVNHVQMLKQQRDAARRQLQYTKQVLQTSSESSVGSTTNAYKYSPSTAVISRKMIIKRRASIPTSSPQLPDDQAKPDTKKMSRRISDLSVRASSMTKPGRVTRLELCGDLLKIKEGFAESTSTFEPKQQESDNENEKDLISNSQPTLEQNSSTNLNNLTPRQKLQRKLKIAWELLGKKFQEWEDDGRVHEFCCFCALMCFSFSLLLMVDILAESQIEKRRIDSTRFFWSLFYTTD